jgi:hypothetical protein
MLVGACRYMFLISRYIMYIIFHNSLFLHKHEQNKENKLMYVSRKHYLVPHQKGGYLRHCLAALFRC